MLYPAALPAHDIRSTEMNWATEDLGSFRVVPKDVVIDLLCTIDVKEILMLEQVRDHTISLIF